MGTPCVEPMRIEEMNKALLLIERAAQNHIFFCMA